MKQIVFAIIISTCLSCAKNQPGHDTAPTSGAERAFEDNSFAAIRKSSCTAKIKALNSYLAANPEADDFERGLFEIVVCYRDELADREMALNTLERVYQRLIVKATPDELKTGLRDIYEWHVGMDDDEGAMRALEKQYDLLSKGADSDLKALEENLYSMVYGLTRLKSESGVERAKHRVAKAKEELEGHVDSEGLMQLFAKLDGLINPPVIGTVPTIAFTALDGTEVDVAAMRDKVVLVDFWATWCGPCVASIPGIRAAYEKFHDRGFEVVGVSLDDENARAKVEEFVKNRDLPWPQSFEGKGWDHPLAISFGIRAIPSSFLIGKDGTIVDIDLHDEALEAKLDELLK